MRNPIHHLKFSWSTSKARDSYGYNICRLDDSFTGKRYKTCGGGYDMLGTVFGNWLADTYQTELLKISAEAYYIHVGRLINITKETRSFYGMYYHTVNKKVTLDGGCGLDSMIKIAVAIGLEVEREYIKKGKRRGETLGYYVQMSENGQGKFIYIRDQLCIE